MVTAWFSESKSFYMQPPVIATLQLLNDLRIFQHGQQVANPLGL
jgi:hypothetical protein